MGGPMKDQLWVSRPCDDAPCDCLPAFASDFRKATNAEVLAYVATLPGAEKRWECQYGRGDYDLCREVNSYEPLLHDRCHWVLVVPWHEKEDEE